MRKPTCRGEFNYSNMRNFYPDKFCIYFYVYSVIQCPLQYEQTHREEVEYVSSNREQIWKLYCRFYIRILQNCPLGLNSVLS